MALVRTDYGLIYNTDGSLCATLLPEGGVAVTEGTTNLIPSNRLKFEGWLVYQGASVTVEQGHSIPDITPDGATRIQTSGGADLIKYYNGVGPGDAGTPASYRVWVRNIGDKPVAVYGNAIGVSNIVYPGETKLCTGSTDAVNGTAHRQIQFRALDVDDSLDFIAYQPQIEEKPYPTPFVNGTRPAGALSYSSLLVAGKTEIAILMKLTKPQLLQTPWSHHALAMFNQVGSLYPDSFMLLAHNGVNELRFRTRDSEGNQDDIRIENCWDDDEHLVVAYMNHNPASGRHKKELYFDGELVGYSDPDGMPDLSNVQDVRLGHWNRAAFWGTPITMFCIKPTCTPEMVKTWHSLNAPFFDPREQIDAAAKTIHMYQSDINGHGHTVRDQYGNKAVFSGVDPDTGDRGYKVYDTNGSDEVTFLGVRADGRRGLMMQDGDMTWLDPGGIAGSKVMSLPWTSLDSVTHLLFGGLFEGNFIIADENGKYGFDFGDGSAQIKSYTFKATGDTYVNSLEYTAFDQVYSWRDVNYGSETRLRIAYNAEHNYGIGYANYDKHAYIKFSGLSSIPATEEIVDAELRLYFTDLSATRFILAVSAATWSETTITWNNQPGISVEPIPPFYGMMAFEAKLGTTIIKKGPLIDLTDLLDWIRANGWESRGFRIYALDESKGESVLYSREGHSTLCPTLVVYTRESQSPTPGLNLHVPGGRVFLNRKIFDVSGKTLTLSANRNDITLYVYENEDGEAVIDFAHGGRAFKADSYVVLGSAKTSSSAITETSKERNTGRKEGPRGMGNDVYSFGYTPNDGGVISISTQTRTPFKVHGLGGSKYHVILEIRPSGGTWQKFYPTIDASGSRGITVEIDSSKIQFIAGSDSVHRYLKSDGTMTNLTSAQIRGIIIRLD